MSLTPLSAIDHLVSARLSGPIELVFSYKSGPDPQRIAEAFGTTAREYVGVSATLARVDERTLAFDTTRDASEIRTTSDGPSIPLTACFDSVTTELGQPLTRARIVDRGSQGMAIALSMSHAVADGYGFFLFLAAWAARSRGAPFPAPNCNRSTLTDPQARRGASSVDDNHALDALGFVVWPGSTAPLRVTMREKTVAKDALRVHRDGAAAEHVSAADLLAAVLWKEFGDVGHIDTTLACPVDVRAHRKELGPMYFGNAFLHASITRPTAALRSASVAEVAGWIREAVQSVPGKLETAVAQAEALLAARGLSALAKVYGYPPDTGLLVSNLARTPLSALDFGAGPPDRFEVGARPPYARMCFVLPEGNDLRIVIAHD